MIEKDINETEWLLIGHSRPSVSDRARAAICLSADVQRRINLNGGLLIR